MPLILHLSDWLKNKLINHKYHGNEIQSWPNKLAWLPAAGHMSENAQQNALNVPFEAILYWATEPNKMQ